MNELSELDLFLALLPRHLAAHVSRLAENDEVIELALDVGRRPEVRFQLGEAVELEPEISAKEIEHICQQVGLFNGDNRAGLNRTLHRISAIRNRQRRIIGLTCRLGRSVFGAADILADVLASERSILVMGRPGVGKTTLLRDAARLLSQTRRVIVVDSANEIGGEGDIPHPAIGRARRMQVSDPRQQHRVMIEAVQNHMPEVIVIDEIGRLDEVEAARTISQRGVQLIATAHGHSLENLLMNPTLSDLAGGVTNVTLSDEQARRQGTQKTVLERQSPPSFDVLVEIIDHERLAVYSDLAQAVDSLLRGKSILPEIRRRRTPALLSQPVNLAQTAVITPNPTEWRQRQKSRSPKSGKVIVAATESPVAPERQILNANGTSPSAVIKPRHETPGSGPLHYHTHPYSR
ncbi:MAG: AAA family ATPase [Caldilineales bacterium]|nr:AAA family ATPase [Caldilineales bacterium]